jgi:hypothetical protein
VEATVLFFFAHLLPRQSAGKNRHGKHKQGHPEANQLAEVQHISILDYFRLPQEIQLAADLWRKALSRPI